MRTIVHAGPALMLALLAALGQAALQGAQACPGQGAAGPDGDPKNGITWNGIHANGAGDEDRAFSGLTLDAVRLPAGQAGR